MSQLSSRARVELAKAALSRIGLEAPELRPYQDEPAQMPSGTVGKEDLLPHRTAGDNGFPAHSR